MRDTAGEKPHTQQRSDTGDYDRIYREFSPRVHAYVRRSYPDVSAEDVTQDAMERLWCMRERIDPDRSVLALVLTIATNIARDLRRRRALESRTPLYLLSPSENETPDEHALGMVDRHLIRQSLDELQASDQHLMRLRYWLNLSCHAVGEQLHLTDVAARRRLSRAQHRCGAHFTRLSRVLVPLVFIVREVRNHISRNLSSVSITAATGAIALAVGLSSDLVLPGESTDGEGSLGNSPAIAAPTHFSITDRQQRRSLHHETPPRQSSRQDGQAVASAVEESTPPGSTLLPRSDLQVTPDTHEGQKQQHSLKVDTPIGPVAVEGGSSAVRPAALQERCGEPDTRCLVADFGHQG